MFDGEQPGLIILERAILFIRGEMKTGIILVSNRLYISGDLSGYHSYWYKTEEIRDDRMLKSFITVKKPEISSNQTHEVI
jgi:hypothetical protein